MKHLQKKFAELKQYVEHHYVLLAVVLSAISFWIPLYQGISLFLSPYDDGLFVKLAVNILSGNWLGDYDHVTLAKGPFYPIFLAINHLLGLPLLISQHLLYLASGYALARSLYPIVRSKIALFWLYVAYIFHPIGYAITVAMRDSVYLSLTVLVLSGAIGLIARLHYPKRAMGWGILLGVSFACFWMTREEGGWIVPTVLALLCIGGGSVLLSSRWMGGWQTRRRQLALLLVPVLVAGATMLPVLCLNYSHYGIWALTDIKSQPFRAAYGSLMRVNAGYWNPHVPVSHASRKAIYRVSPAFRELKKTIEPQAKVAKAIGCQFYKDSCNEVAGGWFIWVFRHAVEQIGYYKSAPTAAAYYNRLTSEIASACDQHKLNCGPQRSSLASPWRNKYLQPLLKAAWRGTEETVQLNLIAIPLLGASGAGDSDINTFAGFLHNRVTAKLPATEISGWAIRKGAQPDFEITLEQNQFPAELDISYLSSPALVKAFNNPTLYRNRFRLEHFCQSNCTLKFSDLEGKPLAAINLNTVEQSKPFSFSNENISVAFDSIQTLKTPMEQLLEEQNGLPKLLALIQGKFYQGLMPVLVVAAIVLTVWRFVWFRKITALLLINATLLLAIIIRLALLSYIDASSFPAIAPQYMSPLYALVLIVCAIAIIDAYPTIRAVRIKSVK